MSLVLSIPVSPEKTTFSLSSPNSLDAACQYHLLHTAKCSGPMDLPMWKHLTLFTTAGNIFYPQLLRYLFTFCFPLIVLTFVFSLLFYSPHTSQIGLVKH